MSQIDQIVTALQDEIIIVDDSISFKDTAFAASLKATGIGEEEYKKVRKFDTDYAAATATVFGMAANDMAAKEDTIKNLATKVRFGFDTSCIEFSWQRSQEVNSGIPKAGQPAEKKTKYGSMRVKVSRADENEAVNMVRRAISDDAHKRFTSSSVAAVMS